jgi:hypothetical protein
MKIFKTLLLLLVSYYGFAQQFTVTSKLLGIQKDGLHTIVLTPDFRAYADENLSGIRVKDSKGKEVPYFLESAGKSISKYNFKEYTILSKAMVTDTSSQVIIQNTLGTKWDQVTLAIANTDASKTYSISGSHDNKEWFGLVNNQILGDLYSHSDTLVYKTLAMPVNAYKYIKISFNDKKTLPVNILAAGKVTGTQTTAVLQEVANAHVKVFELTEKKTQITITFNNPVTVNQIAFNVASPVLYHRNATIYVERTKQRKKKIVTYLEEVYSFELNSSSPNVLQNLGFTENKLVIEIDNKDNGPLIMDWVKLYQTPVNLVGYFKAGEHYTVMAGNPQLSEPDYDIKNFKEQMPDSIAKATMDKTVVLSVKPKGINGGNSPWIMWVCIAAGALILLYFCYSLVQDLNKKEKPQA